MLFQQINYDLSARQQATSLAQNHEVRELVWAAKKREPHLATRVARLYVCTHFIFFVYWTVLKQKCYRPR